MASTFENATSSQLPSTPSADSSTTSPNEDVLNRIVRGAHETVDRVAAKAAPMVEQVKGSVAHASDAVHARGDQLGHLSEEWTEQLRTTVREHPLASLAVAVAVGVLVSRVGSR